MNSHDSLDINKLAMCFLLRIPALHGAKATKNQTPVVRFAWLFYNQTIFSTESRENVYTYLNLGKGS